MTFDITKIKQSFSEYIVRPANAFGLGGFYFDVAGPTTSQVNADITDHYSENNEAMQDHIAVAPKRYTVKNYVGELVYRKDDTTGTLLQDVVQKLTIVDAYLPALTQAAKQAKGALDAIQNDDLSLDDISLGNVQKAADLWALAKNLTPPQEKQQQAYMFFDALMQQKILLSLQTPWLFETNLAIESISAVQDETTQYVTEFTIVLKKMKFASTSTTEFDKDKYQSRSAVQNEDLADNGRTNGAIPDESVLYRVLDTGLGKLLPPPDLN